MFVVISHDILFETLALCSINKTHIKWVKSWLLDAFQKVFVNGESLSNVDLTLGFCKDPVLLNILKNDLQVNVKSLQLKFEDETKMVDI